jgi:DNA-binding NarL/FixJ family response regulator
MTVYEFAPALGATTISPSEAHSLMPEQSMTRDLSPREMQTIAGVAAGHSSKEIARVLAVSVKTVEKHRSNAMAKLKVHKAADLTRYFIEHMQTRHCATCTCGLPPAAPQPIEGSPVRY